MSARPAPSWRPALLGVPAGDGTVRCELCPFRCRLPEGALGSCRVRRNRRGTLETASFSTAVAHLDAIERKPFYHVRPGSRVLTLAPPGCTFRCDYCVNHRLSQYGREDDVPWTGETADPAALVARAAAEGADLALSYSEPGLAPELTLELAELARAERIRVLWKSNGFLTPRAVDLVAPALDAVNIDVKAADEAAHRRLTGASLRPVLDAVERFRAAGVWVEVSTPLVPGCADSPERLGAIARGLAAVDPAMPWHLLRFTPDFRMARALPTPPEQLRRAVDAARERGLRFVYVERALGEAGRSTACPDCGTVLVRRGVWRTLEHRIADGACPGCGAVVPGRWRE
ncbi:AmmeMemoRadiSam system radical SAM enzyme [Kitasatospora putterlickiae]|uniref:AmmeMemoRadiSam system radical SAM enzyme n=1 Tax=Kitasatospora putterlickiae TaxID=221725 RepID=A0ABN1XXT0_9ACTN